MAARISNKKDNMIYHQISHLDRFRQHQQMEPNLKPPPPSLLGAERDSLCERWLRMYNFRLLWQLVAKHFLDFKSFRQTINSKCYFVILVYALLLDISGSISAAARQEASNCAFPQRWEGSWFQSGVPNSILIKGSTLSNRGKCIASDGDKFLLQDLKGCHRCVVIYEKHKNVLQYKESECEDLYRDQANPAAMPMHSIIKSDHIRAGAHPNMNGHSRLSSSDQFLLRSNDDVDNCMGCKGRETLQFLCEQIPGDALLFSMFREASEPVKCPLKGPFTFTYNRGHGECKNPVSNIDSCTEDSRLLLSFQACPDVSGTESTVEELTCLATWKDGNARYLVGLVSHHHATSNEERFRCFVYEKITSMMGGNSKDAEYKLAQSGDATCNGLESAEVGSRIMSLKKAASTDRCSFPKWFQGPRHWHALMGNAGYVYHPSDGSLHILKQSGYMETRALCEQINKQTEAEVMAIVHYTTGCQSGFMCMMFYRRDTHVAELQIGKPASRLEDACAPDHFDLAKMPFITLLASNPETQACQVEGLYTLRSAIGPPYMSSRHKRNHNNNGGGGANKHGHHHHELQNHRRHESLSFRNTEDETHNWHVMQGRSVTARSRRSADTRLQRREVPPRLSLDLDVYNSTTGSNDTLRNRRDVPGCITNYNAQRQLLFGCTDRNLIEVRPQCNDDGDEVYSCHGSWQENDTIFIIARHAGSQHGVCLSYKVGEGNAAQLIVGDACYRRMQVPTPSDHHLVANLTNFGSCSDTNSSNTVSNYWILIFVISWLSVQIAPR